MSNFHVGQKVVCVDDMANIEARKIPEIDKGRIYVIRKIGEQHVRGLGNVLSVWLEGVHRSDVDPWFDGFQLIEIEDFGFRLSRFRPVVERKTDISCFKAMLNPKNQQVPA